MGLLLATKNHGGTAGGYRGPWQGPRWDSGEGIRGPWQGPRWDSGRGYTVGHWNEVTVHYEVFENTIWMIAYYLTFPEYRVLILYWKHVVYLLKCI